MTAPGRTPCDFIVSASATWIAKIVGWTRSTPVSCSGADIASVTEKPDSAATTGSIAATVAANTGSVANNSAPIPAHLDPCPENNHTGPRSPRPTAGSRGRSLAARSRSASTRSARSLAQTTVRTGRCARRLANVYPRSRRSAPFMPPPTIQSASRTAVMRSCSADVAEIGKSSGPSARGAAAGSRADCGACSKMACTLVPDIPYDDTAARRGWWPLVGQEAVSCGTNNSVSISASWSGNRVKCRFRGTLPCCSARIAFIRPSTPEVDCMWPKLVFTDPNAHGPSVPYTAARLAYSIGSPTGVPVPCASTKPIVAASTPAAASAL